MIYCCHFYGEKEGDMKSVLVCTLLVTFILQIAFYFQDARVRLPNYLQMWLSTHWHKFLIGMLACTCKLISWPSLQTFTDELLTYKHNSIPSVFTYNSNAKLLKSNSISKFLTTTNIVFSFTSKTFVYCSLWNSGYKQEMFLFVPKYF